jgi:hypothetical protein
MTAALHLAIMLAATPLAPADASVEATGHLLAAPMPLPDGRDVRAPMFQIWDLHADAGATVPGRLTMDAYLWGAADPTGHSGRRFDDVLAGDVVLLSVDWRDGEDIAALRAGRHVFAAGAVRPLHLDGASVRIAPPLAVPVVVQAFGGAPVASYFQGRRDDWAVGGRAEVRPLPAGRLGLSYLHRRDAGAIGFHEIGFDAAFTPLAGLDAATATSFDLGTGRAVHAHAAVGWRATRRLRVSADYTRRTPDLLLPRTSLFSVFSDGAHDRLSLGAEWQRGGLLLDGALSGQLHDGAPGGRAEAGVRLQFDPDGGVVAALRGFAAGRDAAGLGGGRAAITWRVVEALALSGEGEVVYLTGPVRDLHLASWARAAATWHFARDWEVAAALSVLSDPRVAAALAGGLRVSWRLGGGGGGGP